MRIDKKNAMLKFGAVILFFALFFVFNKAFFSVKEEENFLGENSKGIENQKENPNTEEPIVKKIDKDLDSDNDGLPDLAEIALGLDPINSDSDSDGYRDLSEIKNGYNPLLKSPDGKLTEEENDLIRNKIKNANFEVYQKIFSEIAAETAVLVDKIEGGTSLATFLPVFKEEASLSNKDWKYSLYVPSGLEVNKSHPLVIGFHGFGELAKDYIAIWKEDADKNKFIVAVPQAYSKRYPDGNIVESYPWLEVSDFTRGVLADIKKNYKIDESRVFLTGYSAGASASYIVALSGGLKIKGVIPVDGYLPLESGIISKLGKAKEMNFYVVHGAEDRDVKTVIEQEKTLLKYGGKMEFLTIPDLGHEYPLSEHENIVEWMYSLP